MKRFIIFCLATAVFNVAYCQGIGIRNPGPHLLVYKSKQVGENLVPIFLSQDKKTITSYPDPKDLRDESMLPIKLHKGYLLDNKGISENVAYLKMTWQEYSQLIQPPSIKEMMGMITDKDPLVFLCDCGPKYNSPYSINQINEMIDKNILKRKCKVIVSKGRQKTKGK